MFLVPKDTDLVTLKGSMSATQDVFQVKDLGSIQ